MQNVQFAQWAHFVLCVSCSGERVLCFHGPLLYEAKVGFLSALWVLFVFAMKTFNYRLSLLSPPPQCVKINIKDKQIKYFIHYSGWNKK